jgi:hypothetical protein
VREPEREPELEPDESLVLLPEDEEGAFARWVPVLRVLAALLIGAGIAAVVLLLGEKVERGSGTPPAAAAERPADPAVLQLRALTDSLARRLAAYWIVQGRFDERRVGCESLSGAYRGVDDAFVAVAVAYRQTGARADTAAAHAFERASSSADSANRRFDATGCRRPE